MPTIILVVISQIRHTVDAFVQLDFDKKLQLRDQVYWICLIIVFVSKMLQDSWLYVEFHRKVTCGQGFDVEVDVPSGEDALDIVHVNDDIEIHKHGNSHNDQTLESALNVVFGRNLTRVLHKEVRFLVAFFRDFVVSGVVNHLLAQVIETTFMLAVTLPFEDLVNFVFI